MRRLLLAFPLILLASCDAPQGRTDVGTVLDIAAKLRYFHDERTGECFAAITTIEDVALNHVQITWVPCDPKVLALIVSRGQ